MNAPRAGLNEADRSSQVIQREALADNAGDSPLVALHSNPDGSPVLNSVSVAVDVTDVTFS